MDRQRRHCFLPLRYHFKNLNQLESFTANRKTPSIVTILDTVYKAAFSPFPNALGWPFKRCQGIVQPVESLHAARGILSHSPDRVARRRRLFVEGLRGRLQSG